MGSFYRSQHELITVLKNGDAPHLNTFELGQHGRHRSNLWSCAGGNSFHAGRAEDLAMHPTSKPVTLLADAIRDVSRRGEIVLDAFGGSGSTLIAAEKTGRNACLLEIDPSYCDVIIRRFETYTGKDARLDQDGQTFEQVERQGRPSIRRCWWLRGPRQASAAMKRPPRKPTKSFDAEVEVPADVPSSPPPADDGYKVGPGRPPREYQFKPGQSGNPKGAKRKPQSIARDLKAILDRELNAKVPVKQGDKLLTMTMAEAGIKQLIAQYAKGDRHARQRSHRARR